MNFTQSEEEDLEEKLAKLEGLKSRITLRLEKLRKTQVAIMIERNLYLSKLREVENYGRNHNWGEEQQQEKEEGKELLQSIYNVLYDVTKSTPSSSNH
jgi:hypothetical protein